MRRRVLQSDRGVGLRTAIVAASVAVFTVVHVAGVSATDPTDAPPAGATLDGHYAALRPLLARHLLDREISDPGDGYKFLYQAVMGPAHAAVSASQALAWLEREWEQLPADEHPVDPVFEVLRPDSALVRINLAPLWWQQKRGTRAEHQPRLAEQTRQRLAQAFSATARQWSGDPHELAALWRRSVADTMLWNGQVTGQQLRALTTELSAAGWPAIHHSERYRQRWQPHYRVVDPRLLPASWFEALPDAKDDS